MSSVASINDPHVMRQLLRRRRAGAAVLLAVTCLLMLTHRVSSSRVAPPPVENPVVHWQDHRHDWLLVADRSAHELVVYDATTGAPLQRLGSDDGVGQVDRIASFGDRLLLQDAKGQPVVLSLPDLHADTLAAR